MNTTKRQKAKKAISCPGFEDFFIRGAYREKFVKVGQDMAFLALVFK